MYQQDSSSNDTVILYCTLTQSQVAYYIDQTFFKYMYITFVVQYHVPWSWRFLVSCHLLSFLV